MPGYSTDQEYLLVKERVVYFQPDVILLVVYLANDLFDNTLPYPLQADNAKPYFENTDQGLTLCNQPVPREKKPPNHPRNLGFFVQGACGKNDSLMQRRLEKFEVFRLANRLRSNAKIPSAEFAQRFKKPLDRFQEILHDLFRFAKQSTSDCS